MQKHILLAITGLSPQVVTETLYAIHQQQLEWPTEIRLITTLTGKNQARLGLLIPPEGKSLNRLQQLCADYNRPVPTFTEAHIAIVPNAEGQEVDDARSNADQESLADFIVSQVAQLANDDECQIHASLAGGRKTMTFYLGYAMTLFARPQDRLSHVLVDAQFEGLRDFYYPTPATCVINGRDQNTNLDAADAKVTLAEIPFISQRQSLAKTTLAAFAHSPAVQPPSYRDLVRYENLAQDRDNLSLTFNTKDRLVVLGSTQGEDINIDFNDAPLQLAFFAMMARHSQLANPIKLVRSKDANKTYAHLFLQELERIEGLPVTHMATEADYGYRIEQFRNQFLRSTQDRTLDSLKQGMDAQFWDDRKNQLKQYLSKQFPESMLDCLLPGPVFKPKKQNRNQFEPTAFDGRNPQGAAWGLWFKQTNIHFNDQ